MAPTRKRKYDQFAVAYHGNWCGPGWSGGRYQNSVLYGSAPVDGFDMSCRTHDRAYYSGKRLREADLEFAQENIGYHKKDSFYINMKRNVAGLTVLTQGLTRAPYGPQGQGVPSVFAPIVYTQDSDDQEMVEHAYGQYEAQQQWYEQNQGLLFVCLCFLLKKIRSCVSYFKQFYVIFNYGLRTSPCWSTH